MKIIIDTNVAIDFMSAREPFSDDAEKVFLLCSSEIVNAFVTANSFCDLHYIIHRYFHDEEKTRSAMSFWLDIVSIAQTTEEDCRNALESGIADYENAVIASVAERMGCEFIVTRNVGDFSNSVVPAISPRDFIEVALKRHEKK